MRNGYTPLRRILEDEDDVIAQGGLPIQPSTALTPSVTRIPRVKASDILNEVNSYRFPLEEENSRRSGERLAKTQKFSAGTALGMLAGALLNHQGGSKEMYRNLAPGLQAIQSRIALDESNNRGDFRQYRDDVHTMWNAVNAARAENRSIDLANIGYAREDRHRKEDQRYKVLDEVYLANGTKQILVSRDGGDPTWEIVKDDKGRPAKVVSTLNPNAVTPEERKGDDEEAIRKGRRDAYGKREAHYQKQMDELEALRLKHLKKANQYGLKADWDAHDEVVKSMKALKAQWDEDHDEVTRQNSGADPLGILGDTDPAGIR